MKQSYSAQFWIMLTMPLVLALTATLLPTHDDWTATPGPNPDPLSWSLLLPRYSYWRIPENLYGWIVAHVRWLFPALGHCIVVIGHYVGCYTVGRLCQQLGTSSFARNVSMVFYLVSTGMIATLTACDGMSQTWVQTLGLIALLSFLYDADKSKLPRKWLLIILVATFIKENALSWFYIIPFIAFMLGKIDRGVIKRLAIPVILLSVSYITLRFNVPTTDLYDFNEEYVAFSPKMILRGIVLLLMQMWVPIDYAALVHEKHQNLIMVGITAITALPFLWYVFCRNIKQKCNRTVLTFVIAFFMCSAIHIFTIFSLMHIYSSIGMAALLLAFIIDSDSAMSRSKFIRAFVLYAITAICVDTHHYIAAWQSGMMGRNLSEQAINNTLKTLGRPANKVYIVTPNTYKQYSNFYVLPVASMGWGKGAQWVTQFEWPKEICDEELDIATVTPFLIKQKINEGYDCVWIVTEDSVVVKR